MTNRAIIDRAPGNTRDVLAAHDGNGTTQMRFFDTIESSPFQFLEWHFPPGTTEGPHHHRDDQIGLEHYLVTEGDLVIVIDGEEHHLAAGDAVAIPREAVRETRNQSDHAARAVLVFERLREEGAD